MTATILDGNKIANIRKYNLIQDLSMLQKSTPYTPSLAVIIVGDDPASKVYVSKKRALCDEVGLKSLNYDLPKTVSEEKLLQLIDELNRNKEADGILVQLPLPKHIDTNKVIDRISPLKDVDGFHPFNAGKLLQGAPIMRPCTVLGILNLLSAYNINQFEGLNVTIVGASNIVGKPLACAFLNQGATVTICHKLTIDLKAHIQNADILISAIGKPGVIDSNWLKTGSIVIDVGINRTQDDRIIGDINFDSAKDKAKWITPVPGGVGPMTVISLLENTVFAAKELHKKYIST